MYSTIRAAILAAAVLCMSASAQAACDDLWEWLNSGCRTIVDTFKNGRNDLLVSGYSWHTPWTWTAEKRAEENELAWGGGWGRTIEKENGDTDTVYFLVFSDSHRQPQFNLGYAWNTYWGDRDKIQGGLGYTLMLVARGDIWNGFPFPAILPLVSVRTGPVTVFSTYIPTLGGINNGSVLYVFGSIALN